MRKDISKENKHNQSKVKRRPSGLGAPLSWNPAHSIFTSVCVIYLFIYASSQPADYMLCLFMLNGFLPDLSSVLDTDHILPVGCKDGKKKSSQPLVSVRLPPTSQSLIKTNIMNINNNNNNNNNKYCINSKLNRELCTEETVSKYLLHKGLQFAGSLL